MVSPQVASRPSTPGRGLIVAGALMMVLSVVGGIVAFGAFGSRIGFEEFMRDVVVAGDAVQPIPGSIDFTVDPPLDGGTSSMAVGIAVDDTAVGTPECTLTSAAGEPVMLTRSPFDSTLLNGSEDYLVISSARLEPGDYTAACAWPGEPSQSPMTTRFTVGRTLDGDDVGEMLGPLLGLMAASVVAGLVFLLGLVLLIVGLVRRSKARRDPYGGQPLGGGQQWGGQQWQPQQPQHPPSGYPQPQYPQPQYPQPGAAQPQYPQPGAPQHPPPAAPPGPPAVPEPQPQPPSSPPSGWTIPPSKRPGSPDSPTWPTPPGHG